MFLFNKGNSSDEKRICALCEYSTEEADGFRCGKKKVKATHSCRRFIYDPTKKKCARSSFDKNNFTFEPID